MLLVCLLGILTLKSYTGLQKASKRKRSAFRMHLLHEVAKEGQRKTMMHLNLYFGAKIWLLVSEANNTNWMETQAIYLLSYKIKY